MSKVDFRKFEPFVAISFVLIAFSILFLTSDEFELGKLLVILGFFSLVLGVISISLERILFGEIQADP